MTASDIEARLDRVRERVAAASEAADRDPAEITIVAVAKTFPADLIAAAVDAGCRDIGENRAQELKQKAAVLGSAGIRWHFVGPLQTNKVRHVVGTASLIHSVDRVALGAALARRAHSLGIVQDVLVEVNLGGEATKAGVEPHATIALARAVAGLDGVAVRGLMAIPPPTDRPEELAGHFDSLARLGAELAADIPGATELSMGMSRDFETAIARGATIVRIGEAIFGPRTA